MSDTIVEYTKTPGYLKLDGNKVIDAQLGEPAEWLDDMVLIRDMKSDPATLIGTFYNGDDRSCYKRYDGRANAYSNQTVITHEDDKEIALAEKENEVEILACNWMIRFIDDAIAYGKPITADKIPTYVTNQLIKYLGENKYAVEE